MSEQKAIYDVTGLNCSIEEFKTRPCVHHRYSSEFVLPTPDAGSALLRQTIIGLSNTTHGDAYCWRLA